MKRGECELTHEQLLLAYRQLRRPDWPHTLEEAMADSVRACCIRGMARSLSRAAFAGGQHRAPRTLPGAPPVPPTPTEPPARQAERRQQQSLQLRRMAKASAARFDPKRAAANDRDD